MIIPLPLPVIYSLYDRAQSEWKTIAIKSPSRQYEFGKKIDNNANKVAPVNKKKELYTSVITIIIFTQNSLTTYNYEFVFIFNVQSNVKKTTKFVVFGGNNAPTIKLL